MVEVSKEVLQNCKDTIIALQNDLSSYRQLAEKNIELSFNKIHKNKMYFPDYMKPLVSIIIPVWNQYEYTKACLYSIMVNTLGIAYEIIIADDGSTDNTETMLKEETLNIQYIKSETNQGYLLNVKNAINYAKGKFICLLNNDTLVQEDWLEHLLKTFKNYTDVGIVGSMMLNPNGTIQEAGSLLSKEGRPTWLFHGQSQSNCKNVQSVDYCSACGIVFKKSNWDKVKGFDEQFAPAYYEDTDLAFTFRYKLGLKSYCQPNSKIIHFHNVSYSNTSHTSLENRIKFCTKWKKELRNK